MDEEMNSVLVLVDVQTRLNDVMYNKDELIPQLEKLLKGMELLDIPVLWLEQYPKGLGTTVDSLKELLKARGYSPIAKNTFSACGNDEFLDALEALDVEHIMVAGMESHICVYQTARDLLADEFDVDVIVDCVASRTSENKQIGINRMVDCGAGVTSLETVLFELLESADHPKFKEISRLIK